MWRVAATPARQLDTLIDINYRGFEEENNKHSQCGGEVPEWFCHTHTHILSLSLHQTDPYRGSN